MPIGDYLTSDNGGRMNGAELAKSNCYVDDNHKDTCFKRRSSQHGTRLAFKAISRIPSPLSKRQAKDKKHNKKKTNRPQQWKQFQNKQLTKENHRHRHPVDW